MRPAAACARNRWVRKSGPYGIVAGFFFGRIRRRDFRTVGSVGAPRTGSGRPQGKRNSRVKEKPHGQDPGTQSGGDPCAIPVRPPVPTRLRTIRVREGPTRKARQPACNADHGQSETSEQIPPRQRRGGQHQHPHGGGRNPRDGRREANLIIRARVIQTCPLRCVAEKPTWPQASPLPAHRSPVARPRGPCEAGADPTHRAINRHCRAISLGRRCESFGHLQILGRLIEATDTCHRHPACGTADRLGWVPHRKCSRSNSSPRPRLTPSVAQSAFSFLQQGLGLSPQ